MYIISLCQQGDMIFHPSHTHMHLLKIEVKCLADETAGKATIK